MKNTLFAVVLCLLFSTALTAQKGLSGLWRGTITKGLQTQAGTKFELYLEVNGSEIIGKSYVYLDEVKVIEMELTGRMHYDRSISLYETSFVRHEPDEPDPPFRRKYQFTFKRSMWESETGLDGFWQEIQGEVFNPTRKRGRILMRKIKKSKA